MKAYAENTSGGKAVNANTKLGEETIRKNMANAGKTEKEINQALERAKKINAKVTRV